MVRFPPNSSLINAMKISRILTLTAAMAMGISAYALGGFTPLGGTAQGCTFNIETAVSGTVSGSNGRTISHGTLPSLVMTSSSSIQSVEANMLPDGPADIYTIDGRHVSCDIESLAPGIYIISQNGKARKFIKSAR